VFDDPIGLDFDATIITKAIPEKAKKLVVPEQLGDIFVDVVDKYDLEQSSIPKDFTVILQTPRQKAKYTKRQARYVEHWYNSYPADMDRKGQDPEYIPPIENDGMKELRLATVWNVLESKDEGSCPNATELQDTTYDCINQEFSIEDWYLDVVPNITSTSASLAEQEMKEIMSNPKLGRGMLYYKLFYKYDVLVALAKNNEKKLKYGNVQRIVSQMRSGVPVMVEVRGEVFEDFMAQYNYPCAFQRPEYADLSSVKYWTFEEAVEEMKNPELRRKCQRLGLEIAKDFSPSAIGQKYLRAVGYNGDFEC